MMMAMVMIMMMTTMMKCTKTCMVQVCEQVGGEDPSEVLLVRCNEVSTQKITELKSLRKRPNTAMHQSANQEQTLKFRSTLSLTLQTRKLELTPGPKHTTFFRRVHTLVKSSSNQFTTYPDLSKVLRSLHISEKKNLPMDPHCSKCPSWRQLSLKSLLQQDF